MSDRDAGVKVEEIERLINRLKDEKQLLHGYLRAAKAERPGALSDDVAYGRWRAEVLAKISAIEGEVRRAGTEYAAARRRAEAQLLGVDLDGVDAERRVLIEVYRAARRLMADPVAARADPGIQAAVDLAQRFLQDNPA